MSSLRMVNSWPLGGRACSLSMSHHIITFSILRSSFGVKLLMISGVHQPLRQNAFEVTGNKFILISFLVFKELRLTVGYLVALIQGCDFWTQIDWSLMKENCKLMLSQTILMCHSQIHRTSNGISCCWIQRTKFHATGWNFISDRNWSKMTSMNNIIESDVIALPR